MMMPGRPGGQGAPPRPGAQPPNPADKLQSMRSGFNPTDVSMDAIDGKLDPNMSVIEFLQQNKIDPQGPVSQFKDLFMEQMQNADPINKMRGMASQGQPPGGPPQGGPPQSMGRQPSPNVGGQFDKLFRQ